MATDDSVLLVRTHYADDRLLAFAQRLQIDTGMEAVFVIDTTRGAVATPGFPQVGINPDSLRSLSLHAAFARPAWRCGDYGLYLARSLLPDHRYYWMIEHDVRLNFRDSAEFFAPFADVGAHFISAAFGPAPADWYWRRSVASPGKAVYRCLFPLVRVSGAALDHLLAKRQQLGREWAGEPVRADALWPNDEAFVATELVSAGFECADLNDFGRSLYTDDTFSFEAPLAESDFARIPADGRAYHPVLYGRHYFDKLRSAVKDADSRGTAQREVARLAGIEWTDQEAAEYREILADVGVPSDGPLYWLQRRAIRAMRRLGRVVGAQGLM